jgi:hypothetical protein
LYLRQRTYKVISPATYAANTFIYRNEPGRLERTVRQLEELPMSESPESFFFCGIFTQPERIFTQI